jgi:lipopolysaccharide export system protein LptA
LKHRNPTIHLRVILKALFLLAAAIAATASEPTIAPKKKLSAVSLLPSGSQMQRVMLPRYDDKHRLTGVLKAQTMTLVSGDVIAGDTISIEFFNPDRSPRGRIDLDKAVLDQGKGLLRARENVTIQAERLHAHGKGLVYSIEQGEGFLTGPAVTRIQAATETTMNSKSTPLRSTAAAIAATATLAAAPPAALTPEQSAAIKADAASAAGTHAGASAAARTKLRSELETSAAATAAATAFLEQAELLDNGSSAVPEPAKPLDIKPGPTDTVISCDGGMYFDADEGVFVYLKNVRVADPRFSLSGANELKVFLAKKPEDTAAKKPADKKPGFALGAQFGDVERIIATGAVRILQKQPEKGKEPVEASGAIFNYDIKSGEIVLTGGYPWVRQGANFMRANEPNLNLRIQKNGSFVTEGNWDMGGNLEQQR